MTAATIVWRGEPADGDPRSITKEGLTKQVDRPLRRAMPLLSGFTAIIDIERGALDPPRAAALAVKVCQIVTFSS
ncbi:MAG: hypothetical protein WA183_16150 [Chthoniobacterales bacterium]